MKVYDPQCNMGVDCTCGAATESAFADLRNFIEHYDHTTGQIFMCALESIEEQYENANRAAVGMSQDLTEMGEENLRLKEQYENERQANVALSGDVTRLSEQALRHELATVKDDRDGKGFLRDAAEAKIARLERELREASAPGLAATSKAGDLRPPDGGAFPEGNDGEAGAEDSSPASSPPEEPSPWALVYAVERAYDHGNLDGDLLDAWLAYSASVPAIEPTTLQRAYGGKVRTVLTDPSNQDSEREGE